LFAALGGAIVILSASADYDGDATADLVVFRPSNGMWFTLTSSSAFSSYSSRQWGRFEHTPLTGDYDRDGRSDYAIFQPSSGMWHILTSSTGYAGYSSQHWGMAGDVPAPADYDGDCQADLAVFRPSSGLWFVLQSSTASWWSSNWGTIGDLPVPGDYDGDQRSDVAVFRPANGHWFILQSSTNRSAYLWIPWGTGGDIPVPGDYDGDHRTDLAVYRPGNGTWYVLTSGSNFSRSTTMRWGTAGDIPRAGDYDGDDRADVVVFRPSNGTWYILHSSSEYSTYSTHRWGMTGDTPIQNGLRRCSTPLPPPPTPVPTVSDRIRHARWAEHSASPVVTVGLPGTWNAVKGNTGQTLLVLDGRWHMFHSGEGPDGKNRIGLSISSGLSLTDWTTQTSPVLDRGAADRWDGGSVAHPSVLQRSGSLWMYYSGQRTTENARWQIGLALSTGPAGFSRYGAAPLLASGAPGQWDDGGVAHPSVIHDGVRFVMAYAGWRSGVDATRAQIGLATSPDGVTWTRHPSNPILRHGPSGSWDDFGLLAPRLWIDNGRYYLMYSGKDLITWNSTLGHAWATSLGSWMKKKDAVVPRNALGIWREIEWGSPVLTANAWWLFAPAWFDGGQTTVWIED
jgi:predicted GH43/DUF377 family glycosyl hydrolase